MLYRSVRLRLWAVAPVIGIIVAALFGLCRGEAVGALSQNLYPELYVQAPSQFWEPAEKTVYLTFDDGPSRNTEKILDILAEKKVKATFFVSGQNAQQDYAIPLLQRMTEEGHTVALHTFSHDYKSVYRSLESYLDDLNRISELVAQATGLHPGILRFPGGSGSSNASSRVMQQIVDEVTRRGFVFYDWDVVSRDDSGKALPAETLAGNIVEGVIGRKNAIVLCHDSPAPVTTAQAVGIAIDRLRAESYSFAPITPDTPPTQFASPKTELGSYQG